MIFNETKEIVKKIYESVPVSGKCDICEKQFWKTTELGGSYFHDEPIFDYYRITTQHHNWGYESLDSIKTHEFCCIDCMLKFIRNYWEENRKHYIIGRDTYEMEITHESALRSHDEDHL